VARGAYRESLWRPLGYSSYHDYRAHDYGRRPASEPRARGAELTRLRGHRSAADLARLITNGAGPKKGPRHLDAELLMVTVTRRDTKGHVREVEVLVTLSDGSQRSYVLRGQAVSQQNLDQLRRAVEERNRGAGGADTMLTVDSPGKRRRLFAGDEDDEEAELELELEEDDEEADEEPYGVSPADFNFSDEDIPF
jgi:hypothetical protein